MENINNINNYKKQSDSIIEDITKSLFQFIDSKYSYETYKENLAEANHWLFKIFPLILLVFAPILALFWYLLIGAKSVGGFGFILTVASIGIPVSFVMHVLPNAIVYYKHIRPIRKNILYLYSLLTEKKCDSELNYGDFLIHYLQSSRTAIINKSSSIKYSNEFCKKALAIGFERLDSIHLIGIKATHDKSIQFRELYVSSIIEALQSINEVEPLFIEKLEEKYYDKS